ncbi:MAG: molybdenum cofactor biosynthesis protein MoaE [Gammaproteobacteria bacterium]|nr:molybdenum cofactor biosynthesis protein MoaE [Gammaproteobacteria bacterium]
MIALRDTVFDPWQELQTFQHTIAAGKYGACCNFVGSMRDFNEGDTVSRMTLEHYPGMTEKFLQTICDEAREKWPLQDCLIIHRVGDINPNESIVLTAAWSAHRDASFAACRYLIEELKHRAPFWKKENTGHGERWVSENTASES